jgi:hypothetical protein
MKSMLNLSPRLSEIVFQLELFVGNNFSEMASGYETGYGLITLPRKRRERFGTQQHIGFILLVNSYAAAGKTKEKRALFFLPVNFPRSSRK